MIAHNCSSTSWEGEAGRWRVQAQPDLHSEVPSSKKNAIRLIFVAVGGLF